VEHVFRIIVFDSEKRPAMYVASSPDRSFEFDPVMYMSALNFIRKELMAFSQPSTSCISSKKIMNRDMLSIYHITR
jgi:hypothetical protein